LTRKYNIIYADPPWSYKGSTFGLRPGGSPTSNYNPNLRYPTQSNEWIMSLPIRRIAENDASLFLWVTNPLLPIGFQVMSAWGFDYKTVAFCWVKRTDNGKIRTNLGYWTLGSIELCLLGTRGSPKKITNTVRQLIEAPVMGHSCKPSEARKRIEELFGDVPRIELFARRKTEGWDVWGSEVESDIELEVV